MLYDYTFRPDDIPVEEAVEWAAEENLLCSDEVLLHPDPFPTRPAWCHERVRLTEPRLAEAARQAPLVIINHFPLRQDLAVLPRIPRFSIWCGTRLTEDWHLRFRARAVVYGHLHIRATHLRDGVRFEEVSLGYPQNWDAGPRRRALSPADPPRSPRRADGGESSRRVDLPAAGLILCWRNSPAADRRAASRGLQAPGEAGGELAAAEVELAEALEVVLKIVVHTRPATLGEDRDVAGDRRLEADQSEVAEGGAVRRQPRREDRISRSVEVDEVTPLLETPDIGAAAAAHVGLDRGPPREQVEDDSDGGRTDAEVRVVPDPVVEVVLEAAIGVGRAPLVVGTREDQARPVVERQQVVEPDVGRPRSR